MGSLSENEKEIINKINENNIEEVKQLLNESDVRMNTYDENGMTLLEHAAYKGNYDICKLLIERGADVNSNNHIHGYTALMFSALGGYKNVVTLLLESGANVNSVNTVGRNAAQMAAFVGQHDTVSIINNFIAKQEIEYFTKIHGLERQPRLSASLVTPLHLFVCQVNIHPIRICYFLKNNWHLIQHADKVIKVLEQLSEKQFKKSDPNEILSLKFHHLAFVVKQIVNCLSKSQKSQEKEQDKDQDKDQEKEQDKDQDKDQEKEQDKDQDKSQDKDVQSDVKKLETMMKLWIKSRDEDDFPINLEKLLRQSIREFPYHDSALFQQLVRTLASVELGQEPSAVTILSQAINGQKGYAEDIACCGTCAEPNPTKKCSQCKSMPYCNQECQKLHWFTHKKFCKKSSA